MLDIRNLGLRARIETRPRYRKREGHAKKVYYHCFECDVLIPPVANPILLFQPPVISTQEIRRIFAIIS